MNIWKGQLDHKYDVTVDRLTSDKGLFIIREAENILFEQEVSLDYGAIFGPDVNDVQKWIEMSIDFVDTKMKSQESSS